MPWVSADELLRLFSQTKSVAVVGASSHEWKDAHRIPRYLQQAGYHILPVNPNQEQILGENAYRSRREVPVAIDLVLVFRPASEAVTVAGAAVEAGAKALWFEPGTASDEAARIAEEAGLQVVMGRCIEIVHRGMLDRPEE